MSEATPLTLTQPTRRGGAPHPHLINLLCFALGAAALSLSRHAESGAAATAFAATNAKSDDVTTDDAQYKTYTDDAMVKSVVTYGGCESGGHPTGNSTDWCGKDQAGTRCGTCGDDCDGCGFEDCGFCGTACCRLRVIFTDIGITTSEVQAQLLHAMENNGGPDGRYLPCVMAEGGRGVADLRPYNKSVDFIMRTDHNTTGGYVDAIDITISPRSSNGDVDAVTAIAFSSSGIGGAYCDAGQNYKEILMLFEAMQAPWRLEHLDGSCSGGDTEWA